MNKLTMKMSGKSNHYTTLHQKSSLSFLVCQLNISFCRTLLNSCQNH